MLNKALKWVYDNRDFFNPLFDNTDLYIKKMFAELQLVLLLGHRNQSILAIDTIDILNKLSAFSKKIIEDPIYYDHLLLDLRFYRESLVSALDKTNKCFTKSIYSSHPNVLQRINRIHSYA